jgi:hypothetical protein
MLKTITAVKKKIDSDDAEKLADLREKELKKETKPEQPSPLPESW